MKRMLPVTELARDQRFSRMRVEDAVFDPRNLAIGATIMVVGIGGNIGYPNGLLPIPFLQGAFPSGLPAIATAAVLGILLNAVFLIFKPPVTETEMPDAVMAAADD